MASLASATEVDKPAAGFAAELPLGFVSCRVGLCCWTLAGPFENESV